MMKFILITMLQNYYYLFLPIILIWISSIWSRAIKGIEINDPISFSLRDPTSIIIFFISLIIFTFARYRNIAYIIKIKMSIINFLIIIIGVSLNAAGQLFLKSGANIIGPYN